MQLYTNPGSQRTFVVDPSSLTKKVVRNKNTGKSFWVRGISDGVVRLVPVQGEDLLVLTQHFTMESWEIIH